VQVLPQRQLSPHWHPGRRVTVVLFLAIVVSCDGPAEAGRYI
jgi:hypothetical protein